MGDPSARLLRLLSLLQMPRDWTGPQLAGRLGVSDRTVRGDVARLRAMGYPVAATRGTVGGYRLGAGAALPPLLLDDEEAVAVVVGLRAAAAGSIAGIEESSLRALGKLEQVLPSRLRRRVTALQSFTVSIPPDRAAPTVSAELLSLISAAGRDREQLRFDYRVHAGGASRRRVEPLRLVTWGRRWFLVGWDVDRDDWRTFRVDRMTLKSPNGPRFTRREPPSEDLAVYVARGVAAASWRHTARLKVHAPAAQIALRIPPSVGPVEAIDEHSCVISGGADSIETLALYVALLDADVEVLDNPDLVARLAVIAQRLTRTASAGRRASREPEG